MAKILILQGPNLNLLGQREPDKYGSCSLDTLHRDLKAASTEALEFAQSNSEATLIDRVHQALRDQVDFIIFNPAAFTHTSIALRDAFLAVQIPFVEVHLSNIYARETFRHHSYFSDIAKGVISGVGIQGYFLALQAAHTFLNK